MQQNDNVVMDNEASFDNLEVVEKKSQNTKKKKSNKNKYSKNPKAPIAWRKFIILGSFVLLFIGVLIASFSVTYANNKVKPFNGTNAKIASEKKLDFDFDFYCYRYVEPEEKGKTTDLEFKAKATYVETQYTITSVKCTVAIGDKNWTGRYKAGSSTSLYSTLDKNTTTSEKTPKISGYAYTYPTTKMGIIRITHPTVWVNVSYSRKLPGKTAEEMSYILEYNWNDYFISGTTHLN